LLDIEENDDADEEQKIEEDPDDLISQTEEHFQE